MDQDDDHMEVKGEKSCGEDLGALERDLLEYQFSEHDDGEVDGNLLLMNHRRSCPLQRRRRPAYPQWTQ